MKRIISVLLLLAIGVTSGYLAAGEQSYLDQWKKLDDKIEQAWIDFHTSSLKSKQAQFQIANLSIQRETLEGILVREERFQDALGEVLSEKRALMIDIKHNILKDARQVHAKELAILKLRKIDSSAKTYAERERVLGGILGLETEIRLLNLSLDLRQEHALALGKELLNLGSSVNTASGTPGVVGSKVFSEDELRRHLEQYYREREYYTHRLKQLLQKKKQKEDVGKELSEVAQALDALDKLIDQTKRALHGFESKNAGSPENGEDNGSSE
ncbi:hypothetical protein ACFL54_04065 [Planctomycetota bacterium]